MANQVSTRRCGQISYGERLNIVIPLDKGQSSCVDARLDFQQIEALHAIRSPW